MTVLERIKELLGDDSGGLDSDIVDLLIDVTFELERLQDIEFRYESCSK